MAIILQIPFWICEEMVAQAVAEMPQECCGLLAGQALLGRVSKRYPLVNGAASPVLYEADAQGLLWAFKDMRALGLDLLAIYHSHPTSDSLPSATDLLRNSYGAEVVHLIVSLKGDAPWMRGWHLEEKGYREAAWECCDDEVVRSEPGA